MADLDFNPMIQALGGLQGQYRYEYEDKVRKQQEAAAAAAAAQSGGRSVSYGKSPQLVQGPDGRMRALQFADDGSFKAHSFEDYTPFRGVSTVDTGTGTQVINRATGQPVREVQKNLQQQEVEKRIGQARGEGWERLPKAGSTLNAMRSKTELVDQDIDRAIDGISDYNTGAWNQYSGYVPGLQQITGGYDLSKNLDTIKANVGFDQLSEMKQLSPNGSALGSVTERELDLLQSVMGSLDQSQSPDALKKNLQRLKFVLKGRVARMQEAYEKDVRRYGAENVPRPAELNQQQSPQSAPQQAQPQQPQQPQQQNAAPAQSPVLDQARAAIARGAPREAVIARLRENGVDVTEL